jgi:hypothetical protein
LFVYNLYYLLFIVFYSPTLNITATARPPKRKAAKAAAVNITKQASAESLK